MKVKVNTTKSVILFSGGLELKLVFCFPEGTNDPLYRADDLNNFFLTLKMPQIDLSLILPSMVKELNGTHYLTEVGLKHAFLSVTKHQLVANIEAFSAFTNGFIRAGIDSILLRKLGKVAESDCDFCTMLSIPQEKHADQPALCLAQKYKQALETMSECKVDKRFVDPKCLKYLDTLLKVAGKTLSTLAYLDHLVKTQGAHETSSLVEYNPTCDLDCNTSFPVRSFLETIAHKDFTDLAKVTLRDRFLVAQFSEKSKKKPDSAFFLGLLVRYAKDRKKLCQILRSVGLTVNYTTLENFEIANSETFNKKVNEIPDDATVNVAIDNNQQAVGTKHFSAHKDDHMAHCLNILHVVKPVGNTTLSKQSGQTVHSLDSSFVEPTSAETEAGKTFFHNLFRSTVAIIELVPSDELKTPTMSTILPIQLEEAAVVASEPILTAFKDRGNVLKAGLIDSPRYTPAHESHHEDPTIRWNGNAEGNKVCLRNLILGKSTDPAVYLEALRFMHDTYQNHKRDKIFLTVDQALYDVFMQLKSCLLYTSPSPRD